MSKRIEGYWQEIHDQWLTRAFPFSRDTFQRIATDILDDQYTSAEAITKHIAEGSGIAPQDFARLLQKRFGDSLTSSDAVEFLDGYGKLTILLQAGFLLAAEGPHATEELLRQWSRSMRPGRYRFIVENIDRAARVINKDISGRTMMTVFADEMTRNPRRTHFNEGVRTAVDTFMAYSKCWEEYARGVIG